MDDMAQSMMKKSMRHAYVIILLCKKSGFDDFTTRRMVHPAQELDDAWINDYPRKTTHAHSVLAVEKRPTKSAHRDKMSMFCFMQDFYVHTGLPELCLTHQVDTWRVVQRFRDRFSGDPSAPFFGRY
ncbi:hypothetical protein KIW84_061845 [Lathyrus oleraceus]|uniref:Uncharacterized protein n=1 Tax=Pisum sativum TaxID=3888 RepID=A0A9D4W646_PEA|nr:hypothetical protein KIW84_061845 [Pisum sativum]